MDTLKSQPVLVVVGMAAGAIIAGLFLFRELFGTKKSKKHRSGEQKLFKIYHSHTMRSARCLWLMEELDMMDDVEVVEYNPHACSEDTKSAMKQLHPHGFVPIFETPGGVMIEGGAINLYLAKYYDDLLPHLTQEHFYYSWSVYACATLDPILKALQVQLYMTAEEDRDISIIKDNTRKFGEFVAAFEKHLEGRDYICGKKLTGADVTLGYSLFWASALKGGMLLSDSPAIKAYLDRLKKRPAFKKTMGTLRDFLNSIPTPENIGFTSTNF